MTDKFHATLVVDLGYGDAGKGRVVDFLSRVHRGALVVRYCGGPQAAHNVVTWDGRHHTFSQWGAGTFSGSDTFISRFAMVNPLNAFKEAAHLESVGVSKPFSLLRVDPRAMVLTPFHRALNRLRELSRGTHRHGSTGEGIGEGRIHQAHEGWENVLRVGHLRDNVLMTVKLNGLHDYAKTEAAKFEPPAARLNERWGESMEVILRPKMKEWMEAYREYALQANVDVDHPLHVFREYDHVIFEGAQGVLLDEDHGFHPHTTWSKTTRRNALELLDGSGNRVTTLGVIRSYTTRHGDGPMVTEDFHLTRALPELHNGTGVWSGGWRNGHLDLPAIRYAMDMSPVDGLVVTHMDRVPKDGMPVCTSYVDSGGSAISEPYFDGKNATVLMKDYFPVLTNVSKRAYTDLIEHHLGAPVVMTTYGPTAHETRVIDRRYINPTNRRNNAELAQASA